VWRTYGRISSPAEARLEATLVRSQAERQSGRVVRMRADLKLDVGE
jgi:hypothetical protein